MKDIERIAERGVKVSVFAVAMPRSRRAPPRRLDLPAHRHRPALDRESSAPGIVVGKQG
jgi:hypothetical protein